MVLELLASQDRSVHANEIGTLLGVPESHYPGLLRLLDNLVFDGLLSARDGHRFRTASRGASREKIAEDRRAEKQEAEGKTATGRKSTEKSATKKGLPAELTRPPRTGAPRDIDAPRAGAPKGVDAPWIGAPRSVDEPFAPAPVRRAPLSGGMREGYLTVNARGFGFVSAEGFSDDVFIPQEALGGAMHGDRVHVRVVGRSSRGPEGAIEEVLSHGVTRVAGILRRRGKSAWLEPDDTRVRGPIVLPEDIDTRGDEGNSGKDGQAAVVRITRWPVTPDETAVGKLEAILGTPGELSVEAAKILVMAQISELHSDAAVAEAEAYGAEVPEAMLEGREDLTALPLPTIDPKDARDHDDAVWVERRDDGGYRVVVAIADVSSYVRPRTALDQEALGRGCSIYLPDRAIPMLPRALSSNLCSLLPGVVRLCLAVDAEVDVHGEVTRFRLVRGFMKSQAKLSYESVARALGFIESEPLDPGAAALEPGLRVAYELSLILRARRLKRGALDFDLPEPKVTLGEGGMPVDVSRRSQDPGVKKAYSLIEELMLLANEIVARWLVERKVPSVFRVHLPPDEAKLEKLSAMCALLGVEFDVAHTKEPKALAALLKEFAKHPLAGVLNSLLLRSMKQATYEVQNLGHFGLASDAYLHFTSPIRRYPDVCVHRTVHALLLGQRPSRDVEELSAAALLSSQNERKAMEVERDTVDLHRAFLMKERIGERYAGIVTGAVGSGLFVSLDAPFVDVLLRTEDLGPDFKIDDMGLRAVGQRSGDVISLGDGLLVEIVDVSILRRSVYGRRITSSRGPRRDDARLAGAETPEEMPRKRVKNKKPPKGTKNRVVGSRKPKSPSARPSTQKSSSPAKKKKKR